MATRGESDYYQRLEPKTKLKYKEKIDLIFNCDPYTIKKDEMMTEIENFPSISYQDIVNYFLFALSPFTKEELKAYKGLESYNLFVDGSGHLKVLGTQMGYPIGVLIWVVVEINDQTICRSILLSRRCQPGLPFL